MTAGVLKDFYKQFIKIVKIWAPGKQIRNIHFRNLWSSWECTQSDNLPNDLSQANEKHFAKRRRMTSPGQGMGSFLHNQLSYTNNLG